MDRPVIFYHGSCPDGFGGAYAAWKKFSDDADYYPLTRGGEPLPDVTGRTVYFIDFILPQEEMDAVKGQAARLVALDHHIGVKEVTESMPEHVFDNDRSGASIAWTYFHPNAPLPALLAFVEDDDLFRFALPDTRAVVSYLAAKPYTFESWDEVAATLDHPELRIPFLEKLHAYAEYFELLAQLSVDHAKLVEFEGHRVYFATAHPFKPMKSLVGNLLARKQGPFALVVSAHPKGFGVSIRGDGSIDVAEIAQRYGGNGHKSSAGFLIPAGGSVPWTLIEVDEGTRD
jgi:oligoribonuclease NrnB/cAMP/cGMP phosphodiesterase (DHH superfamily)